MPGGRTVAPANAQVYMDGKPYLVLVTDPALGVRGWEESLQNADPTIDASPEIPFTIEDWSQGYGFSFVRSRRVYRRAKGFDASSPAKLSTWPQHGSSAVVTGAGVKRTHLAVGYDSNGVGWLYMFRGQYITKIATNDTFGATWATTQTIDVGTAPNGYGAQRTNVGQPTLQPWIGKLYIPYANSNNPVAFLQLAISTGAADTIDAADSALKASHMIGSRDKLIRLYSDPNTGKSIYNSMEAIDENGALKDPLDATNWSNVEYEVGDQAGDAITGAEILDRYLVVGKESGIYTFDETAEAIEEIRGLAHIRDAENCRGMRYFDGTILVPHKAGLVRWSPGTWMHVGPEQNGMLDADSDRGWGRVTGSIEYGRFAFLAIDDRRKGYSYVASLRQPFPSDERGPLVPHLHQELLGRVSDVVTIASASGSQYLCVAYHPDADLTKAQVIIYELPISGYTPSNDATINHKVSGATTAHWDGLLLRPDNTTDTVVLGESAAGGWHEYFFPSDSEGAYGLELRLTVGTSVFHSGVFLNEGFTVKRLFRRMVFWQEPETGGAGFGIHIRPPITVFYSIVPEKVKVWRASILLDEGFTEEGGQSNRKADDIKIDLDALAEATVFSFTDGYGDTHSGRIIEGPTYMEVRRPGGVETARVANVTIREIPYS